MNQEPPPTLRVRPQPLQRKRVKSWGSYESQKQAWIASNPSATPEKYTAAMQQIARKNGV